MESAECIPARQVSSMLNPVLKFSVNPFASAARIAVYASRFGAVHGCTELQWLSKFAKSD
jgi:hypothetical protein